MSKIEIPQHHSLDIGESSDNQSYYHEQDHQNSSYASQSNNASDQQGQRQSQTVISINTTKIQQVNNGGSRGQSNKVQIAHWDFQQAGELLIFNEQMLKHDFSFLNAFWPNHSRQFISKIQTITSNWNMYRLAYQKALEQLLHVFKFKIQKMPLFEHIYPGVTRMIKMVEKVEEMQGSIDEIESHDDPKTDILYQHYLLALESKKTRKGDYFIKDQSAGVKKPIGEFIAQTAEFSQGKGWEDIFFKATVAKQTSMHLDEQERNNLQKFMKAVDQGKPVTMLTRLCCCPFFYYAFDLSDKASKQQGNILLNRKVKSLLKEENEVTEVMMDICALLNSGGGTILFDTVREFLQIMAKGDKVLQRQYHNYKQKIETKVERISPAVSLGKNIRISLVPVLKNPYIDAIGTSKLYIPGTFVLRVVAIPSQAEKIYYYKTDEQSFRVAIAQNHSRINLKGREGVRKMKKKWTYFHIPEQDYQNEEERSFLQKPFSFIPISHKCAPTDPGYFQTEHKQKKATTLQDMQKSHKYMSLVVAGRQYHQKIQDTLRQHKIKCQIGTKYEQYKFKAAHNSAILLHDCNFQQLLNVTVKNEQFTFQKRPTLVILVTEYLKLVDRSEYSIMSDDDFQSLRKWMHQEHKGEKLEMFRYEPEDKKVEFYLKTQSSFSTVFMYYVLNHYAERTTFKNPKDLDKNLKDWGEEEQKRRFKKIYPRK